MEIHVIPIEAVKGLFLLSFITGAFFLVRHVIKYPFYSIPEKVFVSFYILIALFLILALYFKPEPIQW